MKNNIYRSPLFYVGDKYKLIPEIKKFFPKKINKFIEPFTGGGSVFLNTEAKEFLLNDLDNKVINIHKTLHEYSNNKAEFFYKCEDSINRFGLSRSYKEDIVPQSLKIQYKKTYYSKFNKFGYNELKKEYNKDKDDYVKLYLLLIYGFNRMIRFNSKDEFNVPVGNVDFNKNVYEALGNYFKLIPKKNVKWFNKDYREFINNINISQEDFIYLDPPYLITFSEYNKFWNEETEKNLLETLDELNDNNIRFAISNVTHYKGKENKIFQNWAKKYNINNIKSNYISFHDNTIKNFKEVLVTNYE